jgi:NAD-dependent dihydropyrimidine dehydrogenase PreA subunit
VAFVITQPCIDTTDQACVEVCPVDCIHFEQGTDRMLYINPAECIDCGACQPACPVSAIFPEGDVPAEMQRFIGINAAWYSDPAGARSQVGGGSGAPAPAREAAPAAAAAAAPAEAPAAEHAAPAAAAPIVRTGSQQPPSDEHHGDGPVIPVYNLPGRKSMVTFLGFLLSFAGMVFLSGPELVKVPGFGVGPVRWEGGVGLGFIVFLLPTLVFALLFIGTQIGDLGLFAAKHDRKTMPWREGQTIWRRSEETRRYKQAQAVKALAQSRFAFPTMEHPSYRTHVNVPQPTFSLEFGGGGGRKVFPDILVVDYPGNYPVMVAQVETAETVTRQQAEKVWKALETEEAPLYIYVPSGMGTVAKDYARAAGIKHAQVRTWRRQPDTVLVDEV